MSPRVMDGITNLADIDEREGTVLLTAQGLVMVRMRGHWQTPNSAAWHYPSDEWLPITVLREGIAQP